MPAIDYGERRKEKFTISVDPEIHAWIEAHAGPGKMFSSISHAYERGAALLRDHEENRAAERRVGEAVFGERKTERRGRT